MTQRRIYQCECPYFITFNILHRDWLFEDEDKATLLHHIILAAGILKSHNIYQFCIMPDHVHILCQTIHPTNVSERTLSNLRSRENVNPIYPKTKTRSVDFPVCDGGSPTCDEGSCACGHIHRFNISDFIKSIRGTFSRRIYNGKIWQPRFYDRIIDNEKKLERITRYIINNPIKANLDEKYQKYPYQYLNPKRRFSNLR